MRAPLESPALFQRFPMLGRAQAQVWSYLPQYRRPRHFHAEPELNIVIHGTARFGVGSRCVEVGAGELLGFPAGQDHVMLHGSAELVLLAVGTNAELLSHGAGTRGSSMPPLHVRPRRHDFDALVRRAQSIAGCADEARAVELWEMAEALASHSDSCRSSGGHSHVLTRRALELVAGDVELSRGALARYARCHPTEMSRHFHRDVGVTLVRYRTRLRILTLIRQIDAGEHNLARAAQLAGFGSYSQCHRAFAQELGHAPSEFFFGSLRATMEQRFEPLSTLR